MSRTTVFNKTFKGGVHPNDNKEHTKFLKVEDLPAPKKMVYPISQHLGAPSEIVVNVGDNVKVGELIAKQSGFVSANQHSSVSGVVTSIEPYLHPNGLMVSSIIIENDDKYEVFEKIKPNKSVDELTSKEIFQIVSDAGIVGMGGATFPTHVKLSPPPGKNIDYVIINGAECEPYLTSDYRVMLENTEELLTGCLALMKALNAPKCVIAIESNKKDAALIIKENILYHKNNIEVVECETKYPQGSEKQIISVVTGREVPPGGLPSDVGVAVINVDTCASIARAIITGMPLVTRVVTVVGSAFVNNRNFRVRIGTLVKDVVEAVGGFKEEPVKVILGGPMMGKCTYSLDVPVIKGTGAILALTQEDIGYQNSTNCTRCGKCVQVCPVRLLPTVLDRYCEKFDAEQLEKLNITDCLECGACTYVCPARKDPLQNIRVAKQRIMAMRKAR